jgi:hypothetical protein
MVLTLSPFSCFAENWRCRRLIVLQRNWRWPVNRLQQKNLCWHCRCSNNLFFIKLINIYLGKNYLVTFGHIFGKNVCQICSFIVFTKKWLNLPVPNRALI